MTDTKTAPASDPSVPEEGVAEQIAEPVKGAGEPPYPSPLYAWYVVALLLVIYTVSFIDRQILAIFVGPIKDDLVLSDFEVSILSGFAFALFYTFFGLPFARVADSRSRRGLIMFGIAFWSIATAACGMAKVYWHLFLARVGVGVGEATLTPAANSLIADYFPKEKLGRAISVYSLGIPVGSALAFILGGFVAQWVADLPPQDLPVIGKTFGWQIAFIVVGAPGVLLSLMMLTVKEPFRRGRMDKTLTGGIPLGRVLAYFKANAGAYGPLFFGTAFLSLLGYGSVYWMVEFFVRTHEIGRGQGAYIFGLVLLVFGTGGILAGGAFADRLIARGRDDAHLRVLLYAAVLGIPAGVIFPLLGELWAATAVLCLSVFFSNIPWGTAYAATAAITPNEMRGQAAALYLFIVNFIGLGAGPSVVAFITDFVYADEARLNWALATAVAVVTPITVALYLKGLKPFAAAMRAAKAREAG